MKARFDDETVTLTPGFITALETLMREEMTMLAARDPAYADCWTWGRCTITDLSNSGGLDFDFGGEEDKPEGMTSDVQVCSIAEAQTGGTA